MAQDLQLINEAVLPIHPLVAFPYTLLAQIPGDTNWFSVLDIMDAFFLLSYTRLPISLCFLNGRILRKVRGNNKPGQSYPKDFYIVFICFLRLIAKT
jgi:hypothetical protein